MKLLDAKEAAAYTQVFSYWTLLDLAKRGLIPHVRVGRRVFFRAEALDEWVRDLETGGSRQEEVVQRGTLRRVEP